MKTTIPTRKTQIPSREGLTFHEILADGLIHSAPVFGITDDERFVERVLGLAWVNAVRLVQSNFWQAGTLAQSLRETLDVGKTESEKLCREVGEAITSSTEDPFAAIRAYDADAHHCRAFDHNDPETSDRVRQLIGEALLAGLLSRGVIAEAFQTLVTFSKNTRNEQRMLSNRLIYWANNKGLPRFHPFMELCVSRYDNAREHDLLCSAIARHMEAILESEHPWPFERWVTLGWKDGRIAATFAPDEVLAMVRGIPDRSWGFNKKLFQETVVTTTVDEKVDLPAAFLEYLKRHEPYGFADPVERELNPRLMAWSAYDFAFWMATVADLGGAR